MPPAMDLPTRRYALLIEQLGAEIGKVRGWKKKVAEKLGVHPSYVSRILSGEKLTIGPDVIDRACERLGIPTEFFFVAELGEPNYRVFTDGPELGAAPALERWKAAREGAARFLKHVGNDVPDRDLFAAASQMLETTEAIPIVRQALALRSALEGKERDAIMLEALTLTAVLQADVVDLVIRAMASDLRKHLLAVADDSREG